MLGSKTKTYASSGRTQEQDVKGEYFPDSVVDPFVKSVRGVMPGAFQKTLADPAAFAAMKDGARDIAVIDPATGKPRPLSLDESKALVVAALKNYDPALGAKAETILNDRLQIRNFSDVPKKDLQQQYVPIGAKTKQGKVDPHGGNIRYDFLNGTIDDPVMLAHETGHAIADDYIRERGLASSNFRDNIPETQAYFIQNIVYDYLRNKQPDAGIRAAADRHFTATMSRNVYNLAISDVARDAQTALNEGRDFNAGDALTARLGPGWKDYKWARDVRDKINAAQRASKDPAVSDAHRKTALDKLDVEARYMHGRPMSILTARALLTKAQGQDDATKQRVNDMLMGRQGLQNIVSTMSADGIDSADQMKKQALAAVKSSTASLSAPQPGPDADPALAGMQGPAPS